MTKDEHYLTIFAEECAETAKQISKMLRFSGNDHEPGHKANNAQRVVEEFKDIVAMAELCRKRGLFSRPLYPTDMEVTAKEAKVERFLLRSAEMGALQSPTDENPLTAAIKAGQEAATRLRHAGFSNATIETGIATASSDATAKALATALLVGTNFTVVPIAAAAENDFKADR